MAGLLEVFWHFALPSNTVAILLITSGIAFWLRRMRLARVLFATGGLYLTAIILFPLPIILYEPLEQRFKANKIPDNVNGIIVLGGAVNPWATEQWSQPSITAAAERMTEGVALAKRYPKAKFLFTGGRWGGSQEGLSEADVARMFFEQQGLANTRTLYEDKATSTFENAVYSYELIEPRDDEVWVLVTSAAHMPRAVGAFRTAGWNVMPYPVDFRTTGVIRMPWPPAVGEALYNFDCVVREWMSLIAYRLLGQSNELLPGPQKP